MSEESQKAQKEIKFWLLMVAVVFLVSHSPTYQGWPVLLFFLSLLLILLRINYVVRTC